jgi:hypothetical protein
MRLLVLFLIVAAIITAQDFSRDEIKENPSRFRFVYCIWRTADWFCSLDDVIPDPSHDWFTVPNSGEGTIKFPSRISTYRMPSCQIVDAKTGGSPKDFIWTRVTKSEMDYKANKGETLLIHCRGQELKPWRQDKGYPIPHRTEGYQ